MESVLTSLFGEDMFHIKIFSSVEFDARLIKYSNQDQDMAIRGTLDKYRLGSKWKKMDYFRECSSSEGVANLLPALGHYTNEMSRRRRENPQLKCESLALYFLSEDYREWRIQNTNQRTHYLIYNDFTGWQRQVVNWYNNKVSPRELNDNNSSSKQLFLFGGSGLGKKRFLYHLLLSNCYNRILEEKKLF